MTEKHSTIGTGQGEQPKLDEPQPVSHEDEASAGPHDNDHTPVVINVNTKDHAE
jgi:hypothetical protein